MSFGEFFLQSNNGNRINLNFKGKLKREDFAGNQKLLKIFDYFDSDKSGVIENLTKDGKNEIANIFAHIKQASELREGEGNAVLDSREAISLTSYIKDLNGVTASELFEFLKTVEEKKNVVEKEKVEVSSDGTKTVVSTLQDGSVETDVFYPNGELKLRVTETPISEDFTNGKKNADLDTEVLEKEGSDGKKEKLSLAKGAKEGAIILEGDSAKYLSEKYNKEVVSAYYKNGVMELRDKNNKPVMRVAVDISQKVEHELREFVGKHLKETSENVLELAKTVGWVDKLGIDLQDISINKTNLALSILNPALLLTVLEANGKEKLEEYLKQLRDNVKNGELLESGATTQGAFDSRFERITGHSEVNFLQIERLRQTADKYNNVQGLNQRIVLLNQGIKEVKQLYQNYRAQKQGVPNSGKLNSNFDGKILEILTQFFNGDEDVAKALIQTISKDITSKDDLYRKFNAVLTTIKQKASETKADLLKGESEEELKARYENEYKAIYGQDAVFKAEELITNGKETGGMIQIGMMTAAQMLLAAATMGTGNAALMALQSNALIGFLSTVGTDYALSLSNILSSERGFTTEAQDELHQRTLGTAEFIGFGMVAANPLSRAVGKYASKLFASDAEKVLEGAFAQEVKAGTNAVTRTTAGALTKTTLSLESALEWVVVKGAEFGTEILAFSGLELLQEDEEFKKVLGGQASTLTKLKVMNAALQVMLGSFVRNQALRGQSKLVVNECNKMLKDMGIEDGKLTENKRPGGSNYTLEINGETMTFKDIKELQANFMSVLAENYIKTRQIPEEIKNLDNDSLVSEFTKLIQKQDALSESENARLVDLYQELQNRGLEKQFGEIRVNTKTNKKSSLKDIVNNLESYVKEENFIGSGHDANVYSINKDYVLRIDLENHNNIKEGDFKDPFEGRNFGQPVKTIKKNGAIWQICKRVEGKPLFDTDHPEPSIGLKTIERIAQLPDATLEQLVNDMAFLDSKGWSSENGNPGNFLYDEATGRINIIDINHRTYNQFKKYILEDGTFSHVDVLDTLLPISLFDLYQKSTPEQRTQLLNSIKRIEARIIPICEKYGIPKAEFDKNSYKKLDSVMSTINIVDLADNIDVSRELATQVAEARFPEYLEHIEWFDNHSTVKNLENHLTQHNQPYAKFVKDGDVYIVVKSEKNNANYDIYLYDKQNNHLGQHYDYDLEQIREYNSHFKPSDIKFVNKGVNNGINEGVKVTPQTYKSEITPKQIERLNIYGKNLGERIKEFILSDNPSPEIIDKRIAFVTENKTNGFVKMLLVYISQGATIKIIDQAEAVKEIQSNLESISIIGYVAGDFTQSITDISLLPRLLELSKKAAKDNDMAALKEMEYLVNKDKNHSVELSNESVEVDSQIILYMLSNCDYRGKINFDAEIGKLIEGEDMSHYTQCIKGILYQNPELADIALQFNSKMKNKSYQEVQLMYEELIKNGTLPRKLVFKKFKADEKPIDTMHQVLDYVYRNEHSKQTSLKDPRYTKPITPYTEAGNKIHNLKSFKPEENPQLIAEIKADIEALRKTDPEKAQELQIVLEMFTNPTVVSEVTDAQIDAVVNYLNDHYSHLEGYLNEQVGEIGISDPKIGRFGHRIKGEWSTRDKVANFIKDAIEEEQKAKKKGEEYTQKTLLSAFKDVRDKYACRTVFELGDFTKHPEVKVLIAQAKTLASEGKPELAAAKMHEAELKAAELQSEPVRLQILEAMRKAKQEGKDLKAVRISNYASENGIPIFTPEQMESLKLDAAQMGIDVEFIRLAKEIDPNAETEFVDGASTKKQPSGYTALQINFETKTGEVIEWQYRGELVNEFAEAEHLPYDLRTGKHPWNQIPELKTLYKPVADLLQEKVMPKPVYKQLNRYFTDYYTHLRRLELGFESKEPRLSDYENWTAKDENGVEQRYSFKFDSRLEAKNLMELHYFAEGIKNGLITPERALEEFNMFVGKSSVEEQQNSQSGIAYSSFIPLPSKKLVENAKYEFSRTVNIGKRAVTYVSGKIQKAGQNTQKAAKCVPMLTSATLMNLKLKRFSIKDSIHRWNIVEKLYNSNFESKNVRKQIINSIKTLKKMQVRDWEIANMFYHIEKLENGERILDSTSVEIIKEMEKLYNKVQSEWNEYTFSSLTLETEGNNVKVLNKIKDLNLAVDRGYTLEDAEQNLRMGIRGEENINLYEEILKSPMAVTNAGGLGVEYRTREIFNLCKNSKKEIIPENWELLQQFSKELLEFAPYSRPFEIFKTLKNDDIEITKQNLKTFIDAYKADTRSVKIGSLGGCITKEGKLDLSMMGDAEIAGRLGVDSKDLKNPDGTYNQNAIKYIQALKDAGFDDNISFNNIIDLARRSATKQKLEGEIYSKKIIDTAIELKEYGIKNDVISHIIKLATRKGVVDKELLELYKPFGMVLKTEDLYTLEQGIGDMLTYGNSEYRPQIVSQMIHLLKNGLSLHEIAMSNVFTHEGADGNIVTADVLKGLVQLKQNDFYAGNLQDVLDSCRKPDGSINQEILNTYVELKKQGFDEFYLKHIIGTATNNKGELSKDNLNITLQLMKEFKGSEFCRDKDEVYMAQLLMEICTDKSGNVDKKLLNECKNSLPDLFKMVAGEDKGSFRYILDRALTPDGKFDKRIIEKINELKNLDDNLRYPNEINIAGRFIEACKDSEGNFSIDMYNDGVMLVKKYGFTKHEVSYKLAPYEDFKTYKNKNNIYDLSLQEKRQLQSLLLRYNNNVGTLEGLKKILKSDLLPTTDSEYAKIMKQLSQSLGQTDFVLDTQVLQNMNNNLSKLVLDLNSTELVGEVKISKTYDELLKQIQSKMSGMAESEKLKIYDYFGFTVKDGKIIGFPSANGKSIENSDITNSFSKKVVEALTKLVNDYNKNTQITVEGNPELSRILTSLSQTIPEILNKFSNPVIAKQTIQTIQKISKTEDFVKLNEQDKIILIVAALLKDTNIGSLRESAYHIHTMSAKFSWNKIDREKLYNLLIVPERIEEYNNSNPDKVITRYIRHTTIKSNEREEAIDMFAFTIKDRSLDKMSYLLYADKISPELKTELEKRIYEIKKDDFILPQLSMDNLDKYAVEEEHNGHKVKVVHASKVPDLFAFIHTPEAGIINYASRTTKLSNFEEFSNIDNDAVICASYVSSSQFGAFRKHGLVFKVPTGHEYVGMSYDMTSLGKNTRVMVAEYYRNKGLKAGQGKGMKYAHRTFVSMKLKDTLHITEHSYSELLKSRHELLAQLKEIKDISSPEYQNIRNQIVKINKELKKIDDDYVARMDKVKERCTSEQISLSDIKDVDPTLAKAFEEFLSKTNQDYNTDALMRKDFWNEVLVNEMTVVGEYTVAIDKMPEEYLIKSENEGSFIIDFSR